MVPAARGASGLPVATEGLPKGDGDRPGIEGFRSDLRPATLSNVVARAGEQGRRYALTPRRRMHEQPAERKPPMPRGQGLDHDGESDDVGHRRPLRGPGHKPGSHAIGATGQLGTYASQRQPRPGRRIGGARDQKWLDERLLPLEIEGSNRPGDRSRFGEWSLRHGKNGAKNGHVAVVPPSDFVAKRDLRLKGRRACAGGTTPCCAGTCAF